jgi:hypothetical protein
MRKKSLLAITVVLAFALGPAAMSAGSAAAPSPSQLRGWAKPSASNAAAATAAAEAAAKAKDVTRLVLITRLVEETFIDTPPLGEFNPGDTRLFTEDVFTPGGRLVGHDQGRFTGTFREEVLAEASIVLRGRGQIVVEGIVNFAEQRPALAVVGGTRGFESCQEHPKPPAQPAIRSLPCLPGWRSHYVVPDALGVRTPALGGRGYRCSSVPLRRSGAARPSGALHTIDPYDAAAFLATCGPRAFGGIPGLP